MTRDETHSRKLASRRTIIRTGLASGLSIVGLATSAAASEQEHEDEQDAEGQSEEAENDEETAETDDPAAEITFPDQETPGGSVTVDHVYMEDGGFVSIHDRRRHEGRVLESIIGITDLLEPGSHSDVSVPLFTENATAPGPGGGQDENGLVQGQGLIAIPHRDGNDSGAFDGEPDPAYKNGPRTLDQYGAVNDNATVSVADSEDGE